MIISNLAVLLAERKLKVADLVRSTGINKSTLHKLYNDESVRIDFETIDKICIALDVEVGDLLIFKKMIIIKMIIIVWSQMVTSKSEWSQSRYEFERLLKFT
jgi:putative transcriptional regulator